jgi:hypothetical protein
VTSLVRNEPYTSPLVKNPTYPTVIGSKIVEMSKQMDPIFYLKSLIAAAENSSIPIQVSELKLLLTLLQQSK